MHNQQRLRELVRQGDTDVQLFCSHDMREFERLSGRHASIPLAENIAAGCASDGM